MNETTLGESPSLVAMLLRPLFWACLLTFGLGTYICYPLFFVASPQSLATQSEAFFFEANEAAGAPVLLLGFWLFYRRSHCLDVLRGSGATGAGAIVLLASAALYGWGAYTFAEDLQLVSALFVLIGLVLLLGGRAGLRVYWLPILFLGFALPLSPVLVAAAIYPIQLVSAQFAGLLLTGIGVEAVVHGDQILRPQNTFVVIETCSGVRTMVTLSMLTILLIDLFERRRWHAVILIVLAPVVAFGVNGFRIVTLVLNPHSSIHSIHNLQGIATLLVGLVVIYLIDGRLESVLGMRDSKPEDRDYGMTVGESVAGLGRAVRVLAVAVVLLLMLILDQALPRWDGGRVLAERPDALLARVYGADQDPAPRHAIDYRFRGTVLYLADARHRVRVDGEIVEVFLGVANEQRREFSILSPRLGWPSSGYARTDESWLELDGTQSLARRLVLQKNDRSMLSYSWIERRDSLASEWFRQAAALDRSPFARAEHMLAIRFATPIGEGERAGELANERIRKAWLRLAPDLIGYAPTRATEDSNQGDGSSRPKI